MSVVLAGDSLSGCHCEDFSTPVALSHESALDRFASEEKKGKMSKFRIESDDLTPALIAKAEKELRETPEVKKKAIEDLREMLKKERNLYFADRDDVLIRYLRPTKFYPDSALALMKRVADFKQKHHEVLDNLMPIQLEEIMLNHKGINVLVDRDQDGRRILIAQVGKNWDTSKVSNVHVFQLFYLIHEAAMLEPATQVNGVVVIMDFEGLGLKQVKELTPNFSLRLLGFIQEAMPLRLKQVHIVKQPMIFNVVWNIFKPFIKEKLHSRLFFHGNDMASLHKHISPNHLPEDYAGKLPKINYSAKEWYPVLRSVDSIIAENNTFGYKNAA